MSIRVYNTISQQKEEFIPMEKGKAKIYVCGVTPYNHPHIGNARPFVVWDVFRRYLEYVGYDVLHVQNFTDIDDKIINTANEEGVLWHEVSERYIKSYFTVMDKLGIRRAHIYPKVSTHMNDIVDMVSKLIEKGYAYVVENSVYYRVEKFENYGQLSHRHLSDMVAGARVDINEKKENPMDFALWKAAKAGEPSWESPWGQGRPGWHIECSAMSVRYLGERFDFHGGGSDLIFPHHENEIAQSEACTGCRPFVRYWLHNGFITLNTEKMSKSLGNFFLVKDILEKYQPEVLRFFILSTHYRSPLDFSDELMDDASRSLDRLKTTKDNLLEMLKQPGAGTSEAGRKLQVFAGECKKAFSEAMDDDFNTALAISHIFALAKEINIYAQKIFNNEEQPDGKALNEAAGVFNGITYVIGILQDQQGKQDEGKVSELMEILIDIRQKARQNKDFQTADSIRNSLAEAGIIMEDSNKGVKWKIK